MRTALNNIRNIRCEPGKNIPRANDRIIECKKHSRDEFILQGFNRIENNNNYVSWDISMYREIYLVAEFMDKGANSLVRNSRFQRVTFYNDIQKENEISHFSKDP